LTKGREQSSTKPAQAGFFVSCRYEFFKRNNRMVDSAGDTRFKQMSTFAWVAALFARPVWYGAGVSKLAKLAS